MVDRYTKAVLTVIAASLLVLAADAVLRSLPAVRAQSSAVRKRCLWTSVVETGKPSLGQNGQVKLGREWQAVSDGGWELKGIDPAAYIFEKCEAQ